MANEIKIAKTITYENGQLRYNYTPGAINLPQTNRGYVDQVVSVTSAEADYPVTLTAQGFAQLRNLESTTTGKTIVWGTTAGLLFRLPPKALADFQFATTGSVLSMKTEGAVSATVKVQYLCFDR
jgi:hypothetical protein